MKITSKHHLTQTDRRHIKRLIEIGFGLGRCYGATSRKRFVLVSSIANTVTLKISDYYRDDMNRPRWSPGKIAQVDFEPDHVEASSQTSWNIPVPTETVETTVKKVSCLKMDISSQIQMELDF